MLLRSMTFRLLALLIAFCLVSQAALARTCKDEIRRNNIVGNAVFTTLFRGLNGELRSWNDLGESLAYGATGGYLFYRSRVMISDGDETRGLMTAYLASSISENTSKGDHPLGQLRYGYGPLELAWTTRWSRKYETGLQMSINALDTWNIVRAMATGDAENFGVRNGVVIAEDDGNIEENFDATSYGRLIVTRPEAKDDDDLWHHELIHTTQNMQFGSFGATDFYPLGLENYAPVRKVREFGDKYNINVRVEWFNALLREVEHRQPYEDRWREIEAARLAQHTSPLHDDGIGGCTASVGFQMQF